MVEEAGELSTDGVAATSRSWKCKWRSGKGSWLLLKEDAGQPIWVLFKILPLTREAPVDFLAAQGHFLQRGAATCCANHVMWTNMTNRKQKENKKATHTPPNTDSHTHAHMHARAPQPPIRSGIPQHISLRKTIIKPGL